MHEEVEFNGRSITLHLEEQGKDRWTWWFVTEDGRQVQNTDRPVPEGIARLEGRQEAERYLGRR